MEKRLLSALVLTLLSGAALALPTHKDFQALNANEDSYLTQEKYQHPEITQQDYGQADINKDGKISLNEYRASSSTPQGAPLQGTHPSDAALTVIAYEGSAARSADTSGSADMSSSGGTAGASGTAGGSASGSADSAATGSAGMEASGSASSTAVGDIPAFDSLDRNKDGKLSRNEYEAASTDLRVRGASSPDITTRDKDQPGDDKVMKSTDPSVLQGPQGAGGSGGNASKQPRDGSTGDIAR